MKYPHSALTLGVSLLWSVFIPMTVTAADNAITPTPQWLFVQNAASGTLEGADNQNLTLTLRRVGKDITAFTDRPDRKALAVPSQLFFNDWNVAFANDPPNATLSYLRPGHARPKNIVLELTSPSYNPSRQLVTYKVAVIHQTVADLNPSNPAKPIAIPRKFGAASLFIDGSCYGVCKEE